MIDDKDKKSGFFDETCLLADGSIDIFLRMLFLILINVKVSFTNQELKYKLYTITKTLPINTLVRLVREKSL